MEDNIRCNQKLFHQNGVALTLPQVFKFDRRNAYKKFISRSIETLFAQALHEKLPEITFSNSLTVIIQFLMIYFVVKVVRRNVQFLLVIFSP